MGFLRAAASRLISTGLLSAGWYAVLTGLALLYAAFMVGSVPGDDDAAAMFVAVALAVTGVWQLESGLRAEFQRRPND